VELSPLLVIVIVILLLIFSGAPKKWIRSKIMIRSKKTQMLIFNKLQNTSLTAKRRMTALSRNDSVGSGVFDWA